VKDTGKESIAYSIPSGLGDDTYVPVTISFIDLERALNTVVLSKRKEQAFYLHIIEDMLQREVAEIMDITTVSVGQYVDQAMQQLAEVYFENEKPLDSDISRDLNA
jgi:DNA-directed RNA polymerase specialized sigma24 family protein